MYLHQAYILAQKKQTVQPFELNYPKEGRIQDFPLGGANPHWRGHQPLTQVLFGENICKNERIWSCWGARQKLLYVDPPLQRMTICINHSVLCKSVSFVSNYAAFPFA